MGCFVEMGSWGMTGVCVGGGEGGWGGVIHTNSQNHVSGE